VRTRLLQESADQLAACIQRNSVPEVPACCRVPPGAEAARRVLTYAHKLSYTTFAPPGFEPGKTALGNFRPPVPQEWQMRMSQLHHFAGDRAACNTHQAALGSRGKQEASFGDSPFTRCVIMRSCVSSRM